VLLIGLPPAGLADPGFISVGSSTPLRAESSSNRRRRGAAQRHQGRIIRKVNGRARGPALALAELRDLDLVEPGAVLDRFLASRQRLGDRSQRHALGGELMQFLDLVLPPRLAVAFESLGH